MRSARIYKSHVLMTYISIGQIIKVKIFVKAESQDLLMEAS